MAEQYQEGEVLKGSDGKTYVVVGGVPREQVPVPATPGGVYKLPTSAKEQRDIRDAQLAEEAASRAEESAFREEGKDIRDRIKELRSAYRSEPAVTDYEKSLPNYTAALKTKPGEDLTLLYLWAKTVDPNSTVGASDMENINTSDARLPAAVQGALRELRASEGKFTDEARERLRSGLHQIITQKRAAYDFTRERYAADAQAPEYNIDPERVIFKPFGSQYFNDIQSYWQKQYEKNPASVPPEYRPEQPTGGAGGPAVTVSPEESIATFGQLTYDAQGNLVGRAYQQTGGTIYDAQGNELGLTGAVTEEQLQQPAPSFLGGIVSDIGEAITGSERATPTTEALPDWTNMPEMQQLFSLPAFQASLGTMFGGGPQEIAQIVQSNFPGTQVFQDEKGNYILQSPSTGQRYAIKPGFQVSDIPRAIGTVLAGGGIQGGVRGAMAVGGREAAAQALIEGTQKAVGGTFNPEDIAMAGVGGGVLQKAGEVLPAAAGRVVGTMRRGTAPAPVIPQGAPELPGGIIRPGGGVTPPPAPMTAAAPSVAPVAPTGAVDDVTVAPRMFEAGEAVTSRAGGAMGTSPETIRVQRAEDLPVPVNLAKFQRTRAFEDMQRARELAKNNEVGGPIRERLAQQQQQIAANFDSFLERTGSEIWDNLEDQGVAVSDALRKMAARDKTRINALYKKAKNSEEAQAEVPLAEAVEINVDGEPYVGSVIDYLNSQPTGVPSSAVSDTARQFAVNLGIATRGPNGQLIAANPTVGNLEGFRREMSGIAGDATGRRQEKIIKDLVDAHTEPYAGNLYQEARAARRNYAERYENMSLISNLIGTKKNSPESVIAAEKVVDRILSASTDLQNLRQLRDILQSDKAGQQAWREIQGSVIESLRGKAYPNGAVRDEAGNQVISPAAFAKEVGRLDKAGKLDVIFDNKTANHLRTLADVTQDVFTAPPGSVNFSNSSSGWLNAADAVFNTIVAQIPLPDGAFSRILGPASKYIFKAKERKALKKEVRELLD